MPSEYKIREVTPEEYREILKGIGDYEIVSGNETLDLPGAIPGVIGKIGDEYIVMKFPKVDN